MDRGSSAGQERSPRVAADRGRVPEILTARRFSVIKSRSDSSFPYFTLSCSELVMKALLDLLRAVRWRLFSLKSALSSPGLPSMTQRWVITGLHDCPQGDTVRIERKYFACVSHCVQAAAASVSEQHHKQCGASDEGEVARVVLHT